MLWLILFGIGWAWSTSHMPILCQITRLKLKATGCGIMTFVCMSSGGFGDRGFGMLRSQGVALPIIFGCFTAVAL